MGKRFAKLAFEKGDLVHIQNVDTRKWEDKGKIVDKLVCDDRTSSSYFIELEDSGRTLLRGSKFIHVRRSWFRRKAERKVTFAPADKVCFVST